MNYTPMKFSYHPLPTPFVSGSVNIETCVLKNSEYLAETDKARGTGKCHFLQSERHIFQKFSLYATRQPMVALRLDSATDYIPPTFKDGSPPMHIYHSVLEMRLNTEVKETNF